MGTAANDTTGLTRDAGWELGVRTTVPASLPAVWDWLVGDGLPVWLGEVALPAVGSAYETRAGVVGSVRSRTEQKRVRLTWQPPGLGHDTTLQLTVREAATGTTVGIHVERLADREERREFLAHWKGVAARIDAHFGG